MTWFGLREGPRKAIASGERLTKRVDDEGFLEQLVKSESRLSDLKVNGTGEKDTFANSSLILNNDYREGKLWGLLWLRAKVASH